jgi:hypothetical protein
MSSSRSAPIERSRSIDPIRHLSCPTRPGRTNSQLGIGVAAAGNQARTFPADGMVDVLQFAPRWFRQRSRQVSAKYRWFYSEGIDFNAFLDFALVTRVRIPYGTPPTHSRISSSVINTVAGGLTRFCAALLRRTPRKYGFGREIEMPRSARYPHMEKQGRIWYARLDVPRDLRHHFTDDRHPGGRRILSKSTGETSAAKAHEVAKPVIDGWKARFIELRNGGKTATQVKAELLAKKYSTAKRLDPTEAEYIRLVEVFDFAARELIGVSARAWHERLAAFDLDPAKAMRSLPTGADALEQVAVITGRRTPFLAKLTAVRSKSE